MIFFDTETTGLIKPSLTDLALQPYIIEISAIRTDAIVSEVIGEVNTLIKPPVSIPDHITRITGIDNDMVANSPSFMDVFMDLVNLYKCEDTMIAHNCNFDKSMLELELSRYGLLCNFPWPVKHICTVQSSMSIRGHRLKLTELHEIATGKPLKDAHRAINDVYGLIRCYEYLKGEKLV